MKKVKSIIISESTHTMLKQYCDKNFMKMSEWVDHLLLEHLTKLKNNNTKKED